MRQLMQKLGQINTVIFISIISVLISIGITVLFFYLRQDFTGFKLTLSLAIVIPLIVAPLTAWPVMEQFVKIDSLEKEMRKLVKFDSLTELLSRRAFFHDAKSFITFAEREQISFSIIALDLDKFKNINDRYGHSGGDEVLKHFGITIKSIFRKSDLSARIGGEEFVLLLPNTSKKTAHALSERLHQAVRDSIIIHDDSSIKYTVSMGLVTLVPNKTDSIESILKKADELLYLAKEKGRDCTVIYKAY